MGVDHEKVIGVLWAGDEKGAAAAFSLPRQLITQWAEGAMFAAAARGDADMVGKLIAAGLNATATDETGKTLLHHATKHPNVIKVLLKRGQDLVGEGDNDGNTPLHLAALCGSVDSVKLLLANNKGRSALKQKNKKGERPFFLAAVNNHRDMLKMFLHDVEDGDGVGKEDSSSDKTPTVPQSKDYEMLEVFLDTEEGRKSIQLEDPSTGRNGIHRAAQHKNPVPMELFLKTKEGRDVLAAKDKQGMTALHLAAVHNHDQVAEQVLMTSEGKEVLRVQDDLKRTPLHIAAKDGNAGLVTLLLKAEACLSMDKDKSLNMKDYWGCTPAFLAAENGRTEALRAILLADNGPKSLLLTQETSKWTPLHVSASKGCGDVVSLILETREGRESTGLKDLKGRTPRDVALSRNLSSLVDLFDRGSQDEACRLKEASGDVNEKDDTTGRQDKEGQGSEHYEPEESSHDDFMEAVAPLIAASEANSNSEEDEGIKKKLFIEKSFDGRAKDKNNIETSCSSTDEDVDEDIIINNDNNNNNNKDNSNAKNANLKVLIKKKPESPKAHQGCRCRKVSKDRVSSGNEESPGLKRKRNPVLEEKGSGEVIRLRKRVAFLEQYTQWLTAILLSNAAKR